MFIKIEKSFTAGQIASLRSILDEANLPINYTATTVRGYVLGGTLILTGPDASPDDVNSIQTLNGTEGSLFTIPTNIIPNWSDYFYVGRPTSSSGTRTLVLLVE